MRRRFGRRRWRGDGDEGRGRIDASWLAKVADAGLSSAASLEPMEIEGVPDTLCVVGSGTREDGSRVVVAVAPSAGADALLGGALAALRLGSGSGAAAEVVAVSQVWEAADRRPPPALG